MDKAIIIQSRLGSVRLPNKMILPFYKNKGIFQILIEKIKYNFPSLKIILATSTDKENDLLQSIAQKNNLLVFRGDENNVLDRYIKCAEKFNVFKIIRICGDNPFLDMEELKRLVDCDFEYDYVGFNVNGQPNIKTHFGFWAEYTTLEALKKISTLTKDKVYLEHVTNYIYENSEFFKVIFLPVLGNFQKNNDIRMTIDTRNDFTNLKKVYEEMVFNKLEININNIIEFLHIHPKYKISMKEEIQKNLK